MNVNHFADQCRRQEGVIQLETAKALVSFKTRDELGSHIDILKNASAFAVSNRDHPLLSSAPVWTDKRPKSKIFAKIFTKNIYQKYLPKYLPKIFAKIFAG
ncbi:MAG: hypothetical protein HOE82_08475 [Gammaproteobacteria bacterium]|nr:hypothetical protein [Gammaproteobacteria bacterium]